MSASDKKSDPEETSPALEPVKSEGQYEITGPIPPLRPMQVRQIQVKGEGEQEPGEEMVFVLQDPDGWSKEPAVVTPGAFAVASLFDGTKTAPEVSEEFRQRFSMEVANEQVIALAQEFDQALLLASPRFEDMLRQTVLRYVMEPVRPSAFSGEAYPTDPAELMETIEGFFTGEDGPGELPPTEQAKRHRIKGMILPHIDLRVGGSTYAHGYKALIEGSRADLFVILGVAHKGGPDTLFSVSTKDHATPWGPVKTARGMARNLQQLSGAEPLLAEFAHRSEHSVEFQTIFLEALYGQRANQSYEIIPILCGSCEPFVEEQQNPVWDDGFKRFVDGLREELEKSKRRWCVLASVDLSHVGPKFDHLGNQMSTAMTERLLLPVERMDRRMLKHLEAVERDAFYFEIARTRNSRNVDAVTAGLALLTLGEGIFKKGKLLHYDIMLEKPTKSAVSFASISYE